MGREAGERDEKEGVTSSRFWSEMLEKAAREWEDRQMGTIGRRLETSMSLW